jgi:Domain of unknown function (DUF929)
MVSRAGAVLVGLLVVASSLVSGASAQASTAPLARLSQAQRDVGALAAQTSSAAARNLLTAADVEVGRATAPTLWIDPRHAVAPRYGSSVFADSRSALVDLEQILGSSVLPGRVPALEASILAADRDLAGGAIRQAIGADGGLLVRARGMILSGDRWAATSRVDLGAVQYGAAWQDAFGALTGLVALEVASVSPAALGTAAARALARSETFPAGVHVLSHRPALMRRGKPAVVFVGLGSCPSCAIERWGLVVALSRFGTFSNLRLSESATTERPLVSSLAFHGSAYQSPYISFEPVELFSDVPAPGGGYQRLDRLTPAQRSLLGTLDRRALTPFVDVANQFADVGATVAPATVAGLSWSALAGSAGRPRTLGGRAIAATAEVLTAEICRATGDAPTSVCGGAVVRDYETRLRRFGRRGGGCPVPGGLARRVP